MCRVAIALCQLPDRSPAASNAGFAPSAGDYLRRRDSQPRLPKPLARLPQLAHHPFHEGPSVSFRSDFLVRLAMLFLFVLFVVPNILPPKQGRGVVSCLEMQLRTQHDTRSNLYSADPNFKKSNDTRKRRRGQSCRICVLAEISLQFSNGV